MVDVNESEPAKTNWRAFIQFTASDGTLQEFKVWTAKLAAGDHVLVMYNPKYPSRAVVPSFFSLGFWPVLVFCLGGLDLAMAAGLWVFGN